MGDLLVLEPEPDNPRDINAIRVLRRNGEQIGYLEREFAGQVVPRTAKGWGFHALVAGVGRSKGGLYGMALLMVVENDGASDEEVAAYGRRVLARDREIEASDTGAAPGRRAGGQSASSDRLVLVIAIAVIGLAVALVLLR